MIIIGIDHGYYAIKTRQVSFPSGIIGYDYEPYTMQNVLQYQGKYYVCGTGRQTLVKNKTSNDNYYLLTLAAIAEEIKHRKAERKTEVILAVGLPLSSFGREKQGFREYLLRKEQPVRFLYESELYEITIKDVKLFPQGYSALALHPEYLKNEPSVLLVDIGGWTVDLMRLDNAVPNAATCRSLELGVIRCIDETAEQVRRNTGLSVTETQIERVLRRESCSMAEEARRIIQENGRKYIERILSAVTESGFDLRAVPTVFMGGGSAILKRHVTAQDAICRPVFIEDVHANATLEWRCFESTLHAGKVRANITLALAISAQAINQRSTQMKKTLISENPAFTFRTFLLRLGLIGDEYKNVRKHLLANLDGDLAWRYDKSTYECLKKNQRTEGVR